MMKWLQLIIVLVYIIALLAFPIVALADTSASVTIIQAPAFTGGISNFTITYVSDTQLDFSWVDGVDTANVMIRGDYGRYPSDIPNDTTTPSDGYLVYYGSGATATDTSIDLGNNPGYYYYKAWAQKADGTWFTQTYTGSKESTALAFFGFIALAGVITFLAFKNPREINMALVVAAAGSWAVLMAYVIFYPPGGLIAGSTVQQLTVIVLGGVAMAVLVGGMRMNTNLKIREESEEQQQEPPEERQERHTYTKRQPQQGYPTSSRVTPYRARVHAALHPKKQKD